MGGRREPEHKILGIGERIELYRRQRHMSRKVVANLVGRSEEWLRLVECGRAPLDSVRVMISLADILQIEDLNELIDKPVRHIRSTTDATQSLTRALGQAIIDHPTNGQIHSTVSTAELSEELSRCVATWTRSPHRYSALAERLPELLTRIRRTRSVLRTRETDHLLVDAYHLAHQVLARTGPCSLGWIVADRAVAIAAEYEEPALTAASAYHFADALLRIGQAEQCHRYAAAAAARVSELMADPFDQAALSGAMLLVAAKGASAALDLMEADRLLSSVDEAAQQLEVDHDIGGIRFGPTAVTFARMEMALEHQDFDEAIRIAAAADISDVYPVGDRASYYIASAYAFARRGEEVAAALSLAKAADACPEDIRHNPDAHRTVQYLIRRDNRLISRDVARLAEFAGLKSHADRVE
ncbi:helix-turn-helix domain-containing protein [Nocardia brasiliensis]